MKKLIFIIIALIMIGCNNNDESSKKWENGIIPYCFLGDFSEKQKEQIREGMFKWEEKASSTIQFIEYSDLENSPNNVLKIHFDFNSDNSSTIGDSSDNNIYFNRLAYRNVILHELGHCLGLLHEHNRPDRDDFIIIDFNRMIKNNTTFDYSINSENSYLYNFKNYDFDFESIELYHYFIKNKITNQYVSTGDINISAIDSQKIYDMYKRI